MANTLKQPKLATAVQTATGRVFTISMKGIPRLDAAGKARLEAAARKPQRKRRDYPQLKID